MLAILFFIPVTAVTLIMIVKSVHIRRIIFCVAAFLFSVLALMLCAVAPISATKYFILDKTGSLFLALLAIVWSAVVVYSKGFLASEILSVRKEQLYCSLLLLFPVAMTGVITSAHLGLFWVFVQITTLLSVPFIYMDKKISALEATWKYLFICSVGIALAFVGVVLLSQAIGVNGSLFFADMGSNAKLFSPMWIGFSFVFLMVGFGTKSGLAPMHAWLPDAHSEAPAPASAMLSGMMLNTALLGIVRLVIMMNNADAGKISSALLTVSGMLSVIIGALFMLKNTNYKRMLAYSSIENMGIIAICLGTGGAAYYAAFLHIAGHAVIKAAFFLTSGILYQQFHSKQIDDTRGLISRFPGAGWLWISCFIMLSGLPPSPLFFSKLILIKTLFGQGHYMLASALLCIILLVIYGMGKTVLNMICGEAETVLSNIPQHTRFFWYTPPAALLTFAVLCWCYPSITGFIRGVAERMAQ